MLLLDYFGINAQAFHHLYIRLIHVLSYDSNVLLSTAELHLVNVCYRFNFLDNTGIMRRHELKSTLMTR